MQAAVALMAERLSKRKEPPRKRVPDMKAGVPPGTVLEGANTTWDRGGRMPPAKLVSRQPIKQQVFTLDCKAFGF